MFPARTVPGLGRAIAHERTTMRKLFRWRWVTIAVMAAGLAGLTATSASADVNLDSWPPGDGTSLIVGPGCGNSWGFTQTAGAGWQPTSSADYSGPDVYNDSYDAQSSCDGTSYNTLTTTSETSRFYWSFNIDTSHAQTCQVFAYIPSTNAGDYNARYDFWDGLGYYAQWLGWPGQTVNQEPLTGWIQIGSDVHVPANTQYFTVTLSNADPNAPGRWAGAGDMAFSCQ